MDVPVELDVLVVILGQVEFALLDLLLVVLQEFGDCHLEPLVILDDHLEVVD